jgi:hypothetical protein
MKSHVSMEQNQCFVCLKVYDTGAILLDRQLKSSMEQHTITGRAPCPECVAQINAGFVALIEASRVGGEPKRSGAIAFIKEAAWPFDVPVPPKKICFIEPGVIEKLQNMQEPG